jgi:hypothetical protein
MQPYRVIVVQDDSARTTTSVVVTLDRSPDVGAELDLPYGDTVIIRHVVSGAGDLAGVILAGTSPEFAKLG